MKIAVGDPEYVLKSTSSPAGDQLATVVGQAQGIWYQTDDVVADHLRGNQLPDRQRRCGRDDVRPRRRRPACG